MPRHFDPDRDFWKAWKIVLPATLAGRIEFMLYDRLTGKPVYGSRNKLLTALLERWIAEQSGNPSTTHVPTVEELLLGGPDA